MAQISKQQEREREREKMCDNLIFRLVLFPLQILGQARIYQRKWMFKTSVSSGLVGLDLVLASRAKTITKKKGPQGERSVWSYLSHSMMDLKVVVLFLAVHHK